MSGDANSINERLKTIDEKLVSKTQMIYLDGTIIYVCLAIPGSSLSDPVWQIQKYDTSSGVSSKFADGNPLFDNTATDLTTVQGHSYS